MKRLLLIIGLMLLLPGSASAVTFTSDATVSNKDYGTEQVTVMNRATVTFDHVTFGAYNANGGYEGRLQVTQGAHAIVTNSKFGPGGCSDGIQLTSGGSTWPDGVLTAIGNEFVGLRQGSCGPHVDAIQFYGGHADRMEDNYVHDVSTGIVGFDSNGQIDVFKNNVLIGDEYQAVLLATSNRNGQFTHNVVLGRQLRMDPGHGNVAPTGNVIRDNVASDIAIVGGSNNTVTNNLTSATFVGGTGRCAYATASPKGTASDGTDIGLNDCAGGPPPPPVDHQPVAAFTYSPSSPVVGQTVTFNVSGSTCEDAPCRYTLTDEPGAWPITSGPGPNLTFAFQGAGTKHATLRVTDADGDVSPAVTHDVVVGSAPPPPSPPSCDDACVADLRQQIATLTSSRDAWKARAESAEGKLAQINTLSAP